MYSIKRIRGLDQALVFQKTSKKYIGIEFPLSYLRRSKIFGVFDDDNQLVGGFLIVMEGDLRSFESLPSLTCLPKKIDRWDVAEVNSLWLSKELRKSASSIVFWLFVIFQLLISGKKYFTYTYSTSKSRLGNFYGRARPITIFEGETKILEGMKEAEVESIEVVSRFNVAIAPIRSIAIITDRLMVNFKKLRSS